MEHNIGSFTWMNCKLMAHSEWLCVCVWMRVYFVVCLSFSKFICLTVVGVVVLVCLSVGINVIAVCCCLCLYLHWCVGLFFFCFQKHLAFTHLSLVTSLRYIFGQLYVFKSYLGHFTNKHILNTHRNIHIYIQTYI